MHLHETPCQGSTYTLTILGQHWDKYHPQPHHPDRHYRQSITGSRDTLTIPGQNYSSPLPPVRVSRDTLTILGQRSWSATKTQWSINFLCWSKCEKHGDHPYWIVSCPDPMHVRTRGSGYTSPNPWACFRM